MKTRTKALLLSLCAVLLVVTTVFATLAYLTSATNTIENTFSVGQVKITLDETDVDGDGKVIAESPRVSEAQTYKLIPGNTYSKDPTIHVIKDSEACWVFAKVENTLGTAATYVDGQDPIDLGWSTLALDPAIENTIVYYKQVSADDAKKGTSLVVFNGIVCDDQSVQNGATGGEINVTGYAVQSENVDGAAAAWSLVKDLSADAAA